jgi:hypothetical protein
MLRSASQISLVAASSLGKWPRVLVILSRPGVDAFDRVGRVDHLSHRRREGDLLEHVATVE